MYIIKLILFIILVLLLGILYLPLLGIFYPWRRTIGPALLQFASILVLIIFRIKIEHSDKIDPALSREKGIIILSNHVNLLDIFILSALYRTIFVSKIEVKYYPLFGQIAALMGVIFLKRDSIADRHLLIRKLAENAAGRIISIFPQGTTSSLSDPLPFKCGIFKTVEINNDLVLLPVTIRYEEDKDIAWTGNQHLLDNIKSVCRKKRIYVSVNIHKPVTFKDYEKKTITEICRETEKTILSIK